MSIRTGIALVLAAALLADAPAARAGSIWAKGQKRTRQLYSDDTAHNVGDSLTIVISEQSKIENETTRKLEKSASRSGKASGTADLGNTINWLKNHVWKMPNVDFSHESANKFDGKAEFDSDRKVTDRMTVTVEDVLPNGNLVVLGKRERTVSGDKQVIEASGIVRPSDIAYDNTISSEKVAEFKMVYKSHGQENNFTSPNWFAKFLNWLNPE